MEKGTIRTVKGDVTNPQFSSDNEIAVIPHCCNNGYDERGIGVMGAGVAKALKDKWPKVYEVYKKMEKESPNGLKNRLGENCYAKVGNRAYVVNMIGQDGVGRDGDTIPVKYWALQSCMSDIRNFIGLVTPELSTPQNEPVKLVIHCCKFGSDLAGGCWDFLLELIREQWLEKGIDVVVYEFEK